MKSELFSPRPRASQIALLERADTFYPEAVSGQVRSDWKYNVPAHSATGRLRTAPYFAEHTTYAMGQRWLCGSDRADVGQPYHPLYWDNTISGWVWGPTLAPMTHDATPNPILIRAKPTDGTHGYVLTERGVIGEVSMPNGTWTIEGDADDWLLRTNTPHLIDDGGAPPHNFGYGYRGSLTSSGGGGFGILPDLGVRPFNPFITITYDNQAAAEAAYALLGYQPVGYGVIGYGRIVNFWSMDSADPLTNPLGDWYALVRMYLQGEQEVALDLEGQPVSACVALIRLVAGEEPSTLAAWNSIVAIHSPYSLLSPPIAEQGWDSPHFWVVQTDDFAYYSANPKQHGSSHDTVDGGNAAVIYSLAEGRHEPEVALSFATNDSYAGPLCKVQGDVYAPIVEVPEALVVLKKLDHTNQPHGWSTVSTHSWIANPHLGAAWGYGKYVHILLGKEPGTQGITSIAQPPFTAWEQLNYEVQTGVWELTTHSYPGPNVSAMGLDPRMFNLSGSDIETGGGGGGGGGGSGNCDADFQIIGPTTISQDLFTAIMTSYNSPLLDEHVGGWYFDTGVLKGLNMAFWLAIVVKESEVGSNPAQMDGAYNVGNIRRQTWGRQIGSWTTACCGVFGAYANWTDGALDEMDLWFRNIYRGLTISQAIHVYAPGFENDTTQYINQLCGRLYEWQAES
jgi:hypothetical protein